MSWSIPVDPPPVPTTRDEVSDSNGVLCSMGARPPAKVPKESSRHPNASAIAPLHRI